MPSLRNFALLCAILVAPFMVMPVAAQSMDELESRLGDHPSLAALTYQAEANRERGQAATALPDPVVSVGINNFPIFDPSFSDFLPTNKAIGVRQEFPNRAGREARAGEARTLAAQSDLVRSAQLAALRGELIAKKSASKSSARSPSAAMQNMTN